MKPLAQKDNQSNARPKMGWYIPLLKWLDRKNAIIFAASSLTALILWLSIHLAKVWN